MENPKPKQFLAISLLLLLLLLVFLTSCGSKKKTVRKQEKSLSFNQVYGLKKDTTSITSSVFSLARNQENTSKTQRFSLQFSPINSNQESSINYQGETIKFKNAQLSITEENTTLTNQVTESGHGEINQRQTASQTADTNTSIQAKETESSKNKTVKSKAYLWFLFGFIAFFIGRFLYKNRYKILTTLRKIIVKI